MIENHTPGPWRVQPLSHDRGATLAIVGQGSFIVAQIPPDPDIQTADEPDYESVVRYPCDEANARMLAASPALYRALKGLLHAVSQDIQERPPSVKTHMAYVLAAMAVQLVEDQS